MRLHGQRRLYFLVGLAGMASVARAEPITILFLQAEPPVVDIWKVSVNGVLTTTHPKGSVARVASSGPNAAVWAIMTDAPYGAAVRLLACNGNPQCSDPSSPFAWPTLTPTMTPSPTRTIPSTAPPSPTPLRPTPPSGAALLIGQTPVPTTP